MYVCAWARACVLTSKDAEEHKRVSLCMNKNTHQAKFQTVSNCSSAEYIFLLAVAKFWSSARQNIDENLLSIILYHRKKWTSTLYLPI